MLDALHQEGHPVFWYAILRVAHALTDSQLVLPVIALIIGITAAYMILRYAPFPLWARLLAVFGTFLVHEMSVVARNYGVGVLLLSVAAASFERRATNPWRLAAALALLANTSVHAAAAAGLLLLMWATDLFREQERRTLLRAVSIAAIAVTVAGIAFALVTARPSADMAYADSMSGLSVASVFRSILIDPGAGLSGNGGSNILAFGEIPWGRAGLDGRAFSRVMVTLALLSVAWCLRRTRRALAVFVVSVLVFQFLFTNVYAGALRHQGILFFLIVTLCWIAAAPQTEQRRKRIAFGLLPLLAAQTLALPFVIWRQVRKPESMAAEFSRVIAATPRYHNAVLMSEPDYLMETMPYYVANPVFMARQREYHHRVYFDRGARRTFHMSLGHLLDVADSVGCVTRRTVLLPVGHRQFLFRREGIAQLTYGATFRWTAEEQARLNSRGTMLTPLPGATSDENYQTFELPPLPPQACPRTAR